jgi:hypothetical protein
MTGQIDHVPLALLPANVLLRAKRRGKIAAKNPGLAMAGARAGCGDPVDAEYA